MTDNFTPTNFVETKKEEKRIIKLEGVQSPEPLLRAKDVAKLLDLTPAAIHQYVRRNQIPAYRLAGGKSSIRFRESEIVEWIKSKKVKIK